MMENGTTFYGDAESDLASSSTRRVLDRTEEVLDVLTRLSCYGLLGQVEILEKALAIAVAAYDVGMAIPENAFVASEMDINRN